MKWQVMGILNVTPDSFYDGGLHSTKALSHASEMVDAGASIVDVGGESTRPGSAPVSVQEELDRVIPVVEAIAQNCAVTISVDTTKATVAQAALRAGAHWVNDVSAGRFDSTMARVCAENNATVVLMHSRQTPETMQDNPFYRDLFTEVRRELFESVAVFQKAGVPAEQIILDPGIGFGKRLEDNLALLGSLSLFGAEYPLLIGTSRKSMIGQISGAPVEDRLPGSLATIGESYRHGARLFRVHDVAETVQYLQVLEAIQQAGM